jgi:hypothetical protein
LHRPDRNEPRADQDAAPIAKHPRAIAHSSSSHRRLASTTSRPGRDQT